MSEEVITDIPEIKEQVFGTNTELLLVIGICVAQAIAVEVAGWKYIYN